MEGEPNENKELESESENKPGENGDNPNDDSTGKGDK